jgi:hypothetical protein
MTWIAIVAAVMVSACWGSTSGPASSTTPGNVSAQRAPSCKTTVEHASVVSSLPDEEDVTMTIGECEQHEWPGPARECVVGAHTSGALVACGTTYNLTSGIFVDREKAMKEMAHFRDEMCACKDVACAERVSDAMSKWSYETDREVDTAWKLTGEEAKRATEVGESMGKCMQRAMSPPNP